MINAAKNLVRQGWRNMLSIYYANTPIWRLLKSGALAFLGVFLWAGGNLTRSYFPNSTFLNYVIAYGVLVFFYGPFTHLVIIPIVIRWRKRRGGFRNKIAKRMSKLNLTFFIILVILLGAYAPGFMFLNFDVESGGSDVDPDINCVDNGDVIECELTETEGVGQVVVTSGEKTLVTVDEPPYEFEVSKDEMVEVVGQKSYVIEVRDEDGEMQRRFSRTAPP